MDGASVATETYIVPVSTEETGTMEDGAGDKLLDGDDAGSELDSVNDRVFCCQDCGEAFREEAAYSEHRRQHLRKNAYLDVQLEDLHDAEKDNETDHFCTLCSLSFVELTEFHLHMEKHHGQTSQKTNSGIKKRPVYECEDCGKCYCKIGHFLNHQRSHKPASSSVLQDPEHLKKRPFQCETCGRNYSRASALDAHRRCHEEKLIKSQNRSSGQSLHPEEPMLETKPHENQGDDAHEKLFKCVCGKSFSALSRLKTHQRFSRNSLCSPEEIKEKSKKNGAEFYCHECNKVFNGQIGLLNHQRWHANHSAQRFSCEECGKVLMTLTSYYRHQRTAHSHKTPAKSFLHQVCQLKKKAFECKDCGLKFSRASALHSHQLHHTDVFKEAEKEAQAQTFSVPQQFNLEIVSQKNEHPDEEMESEIKFPCNVTEEDSEVNETDEDMESYEPGDFNVQVISASESEDEPVQDLNPDLELVCESDQEARDDGDCEISSSSLVSRTGMDLKIVQIDFEQADGQHGAIEREPESQTTEERFDCPQCYRWFTSASSLRVHRMWHNVHKRRRQTQGQSAAVYTCDTCGHEASSYAAHCRHIQQHTTQNTNNNTLQQEEGLDRKNLTCSQCGKSFSRLSTLLSHELHHHERKQFQCPGCMTSYLHAASLLNHMKKCSRQKTEKISDATKKYNPTKTLLGPKLYHCEHCGKGFWSLGAYSHHKQNQTECADLRLRKGIGGSSNGHSHSGSKVACPVCGRKFRHRGIMALHMRKHENGNHKCELCNRSFRLFSSLLRHQVVHSDQLLPTPVKSFQHQVEQLKKNTYSCPDCGKLFSRAKALQFHMTSHGYEIGFSLPPSSWSPGSAIAVEERQCPTCFAHFNNKTSLRAHQKRCIKKDSQAAEVESSENSEMLKIHKDISQEISECVNTEGELKTEEQTDASEPKYKCNKCDKSFSVVGALNFHKRIHTDSYKSAAKANLAASVILQKTQQEGKGPFHCSDCGRRFMSNSALGSHKRWHKDKKCSRSPLKDDDSKSASKKTEDGSFPCKKCGKQFFNHCVLQRHQMLKCRIITEPMEEIKTEPQPSDFNTVAAEIRSGSNTLENSELSHPECDKTFTQSLRLDPRYEEEKSKIREEEDDKAEKGKSTSSNLKPKGHQCPDCSMNFCKVHSKGTRGKSEIHLNIKNEPVRNEADSSVVDDAAAAASSSVVVKTNSLVVGGRESPGSTPPPVKFILCLDCGIQCSSAAMLLKHKNVCPEVKHESKQLIQTPETTSEGSPTLSRQSEHTAKYLFKCDKCGKAFQTEEQLNEHKTKSKSRPFCCALCCHGFWTENQLQQHLTWHDEVRGRLPNELRYRLSVARTSKPLKLTVQSADNPTKSFPSSTLNQSQSSHKCQSCGKAFRSPTALKQHETEHCNGNSYHCSVCPRTFSQIHELIDHHQECVCDHERPSVASADGETNGLKCFECGTTFSQETDMHQHYMEHACGEH